MTTVLDTEEGKRLMEQVRIGLDAEAFLRTPLGNYICDRMIAMRHDALAQLEEVDPLDTGKVGLAQVEARIPRMILQMISDCVQEGRQAEELLTRSDC